MPTAEEERAQSTADQAMAPDAKGGDMSDFSDGEKPSEEKGQASTESPPQQMTGQQQQQHQPQMQEISVFEKLTEHMNTMMIKLMQEQTKMTERLFKEIKDTSSEKGKESGGGDKYPRRQHENRLEPKSFQRMNQFAGGEGFYREWSFDVLITAEAVCPGISAMVENI